MKIQSSMRPVQSSIRKNSVRRPPVPEYNNKEKEKTDLSSLLKIKRP